MNVREEDVREEDGEMLRRTIINTDYKPYRVQ